MRNGAEWCGCARTDIIALRQIYIVLGQIYDLIAHKYEYEY